MTNLKSREIVLTAYPEGLPTAANFEVKEVDVPAPKDGEFVVRNQWMSVDPYMRGRMTQRDSYIPPFALGEALQGGAIGKVIISNNPDFPEGTLVNSMYGWRELFVSDGSLLSKVEPMAGVPTEAFLGTMGMPGMTAYVGLMRIGELKDGETVFISAASGAVGQVAAQIAKSKGCYVVGSAGSTEKCDWLLEACGVDAAINYKDYKNADELTAKLNELFPKGIDVYFENVGGMHLEAALNAMAQYGRIALCGMISMYNDVEPTPGPSNMFMAIGKELKLRGFIVSNHFDMLGEFLECVGGLIASGKMATRETVLEGVEKAPEAFLNLFSGANFGKMLVKLDPEA